MADVSFIFSVHGNEWSEAQYGIPSAMSENNNSSLLGHFDTELKLKLLGVRSSDFFGVPDLQARHPQILFSGLALLQHYELFLDVFNLAHITILISLILTILIISNYQTLGWGSRFWCIPPKSICGCTTSRVLKPS